MTLFFVQVQKIKVFFKTDWTSLIALIDIVFTFVSLTCSQQLDTRTVLIVATYYRAQDTRHNSTWTHRREELGRQIQSDQTVRSDRVDLVMVRSIVLGKSDFQRRKVQRNSWKHVAGVTARHSSVVAHILSNYSVKREVNTTSCRFHFHSTVHVRSRQQLQLLLRGLQTFQSNTRLQWAFFRLNALEHSDYMLEISAWK